MIALDTNILERFLVRDDEKQSATATRLIKTLSSIEPGYVSTVALVELFWVLDRIYNAPRSKIADALALLLGARELFVENRQAAHLALAAYEATKADFPDALIVHTAKLAGCSEILTFDKAAAKLTGMRLL